MRLLTFPLPPLLPKYACCQLNVQCAEICAIWTDTDRNICLELLVFRAASHVDPGLSSCKKTFYRQQKYVQF